jgi:hypothetical protein
VAAADEGLGAHKTHLTYRWNKFIQRRRELEARRTPLPAAPLRACARALTQPHTRAAAATRAQKYEGGVEEFSLVRAARAFAFAFRTRTPAGVPWRLSRTPTRCAARALRAHATFCVR